MAELHELVDVALEAHLAVAHGRCCIEGARRGGGHRRQEDLTSVSFEGDTASATTAESMTAQVLRKPTTVERD